MQSQQGKVRDNLKVRLQYGMENWIRISERQGWGLDDFGGRRSDLWQIVREAELAETEEAVTSKKEEQENIPGLEGKDKASELKTQGRWSIFPLFPYFRFPTFRKPLKPKPQPHPLSLNPKP